MPRLLLLFPIILMVTLALAGASIAHAQTVPLEWDDNPDELLPGYAAELRVHAFGTALTGIVPVGSFADAAGCVGSLCFGIVGDDGVIPITVKIRMAGYEQEIDKIYVGYKEYDAHFTLKLYCTGEDVGGLAVDENHAVLEVYSWELGRRDYYVVDVSNRMAPDLRGFYEETYTGQRSWYEFYDFTKFKDCSGDYIGDLPDDSSGNAPNGDGLFNINLTVDLTYLGLGIIVLIVILIIARVRR